MNEDALKRYGVKKILQTASGREYIGKLQKQYEKDLIQPGDPRFQKVYGSQIKHREDVKRRNEDISKAMWEKSDWEKQQRVPLEDRKRFKL